MRKSIVAGVAVICLGLAGCGADSTVTTVTEYDTLTVRDTLYRDTLYDTTVVHDTTIAWDTLFDTMFVPPGRSSQVFTGIVYDISSFHPDSIDTARTLDSVYVGLTCFSNPRRQDLRVSVNGDSITRLDGQSNYVVSSVVYDLMQGYMFPALNLSALSASTLYEDRVAVGNPYRFQVVVPVYPADSTQTMAYDTVQDSIRVPAVVDSIVVASGRGVHALTYSATVPFPIHIVPGDSAITVSWKDLASYYVVTVYKYDITATGAYVVEQPFDTIVPGASVSLARGYLRSGSGSAVYDLAEVDIVGVNGPEPSSWDTLASFGSRGILIALNAEYTYEILVPERSPILGKSPVGRAVGLPAHDALAQVKQALGM